MEGSRICPVCPSCGWKFQPLPAYRVATTIHDRTCRNPKCRERWRMKVNPIPVRVTGMEVRVVEFTAFLGRVGPNPTPPA